MRSEWIGLIGALSGALLTGLISIATSKIQLRHEREKLLIENEIAMENEKTRKLIALKEELFGLIDNIKFEFSLTKNNILAEQHISIKDFNVHYEKTNQKVMRARLLAYLYFPNLIEYVNRICELSNLIWGNQQDYFNHSEEDKKIRQSLLNDIVNYSMTLSEKCIAISNLLPSINSIGDDEYIKSTSFIGGTVW